MTGNHPGPPPPESFHMTPDEFRAHGAEVVEWVARYMESVEEHPVLSQVEPGDIRASLPEHPPEDPEPFADVLADVDRLIVPGITHWQSPDFFAYFPANASGPSILGELLSAGLGVQGMLWATSPACTELETHVLDWLVELLGLPDRFRSDGAGGAVIQHSASDATLCALLAARSRAGVSGDLSRLTAYTSSQAHSSVVKAVRIAGMAEDQLRTVDVDADFAMRPDALKSAMASDWEAGLQPFFVMATRGTTSSLAFDPVVAIADVVEPMNAWLHVDGAMAGSAAVHPDHRWVNDGLERADSYAFNPHKWLFTNFDCDAFFIADRGPLLEALSILPDYLRNAATDEGTVIDYRDWHVPLGRRFRALKLWFVLRHYGASGLRHHIDRHVALARDLVERVEGDDRWVLAAPALLNLVCIRHIDGDERTMAILEEINRSGEQYLTHTRLADQAVIRISIGQTHTEQRHVDALWQHLQALT